MKELPLGKNAPQMSRWTMGKVSLSELGMLFLAFLAEFLVAAFSCGEFFGLFFAKRCTSNCRSFFSATPPTPLLITPI